MSKLLSDFIHKGIKPSAPGPQVDGRTAIKQETLRTRDDYSESSSDDENYAEACARKEMRKYAEAPIYEPRFDGMRMDIVDDMSSIAYNSELNAEINRQEVYQKYNFDRTIPNRSLTIHSYKDQILNVIKTNPVTIIDGPTGCGKTTQVPQYILDECRLEGKYCNIVVTQPRKIATINVARRVCEERGWTLGTVCGYQVGLEKQVGPDVILTYMTTGVLLQKLISMKNLNEYTHIIVDEVHERTQDLDFLLLVIRKLLFTKCYHTKVILMSATINAEEFGYYFRTRCRDMEVMAPIIPIRRPSQFQVTTFYIDSLQGPFDSEKLEFDEDKPCISDEVKKRFMFLLKIFDKFDEKDGPDKRRFGSVLVFLPGIHEIEEFQKLLALKNVDQSSKWIIIPLHSSMPNDEQAKAFKPVPPPTRKIILSTNIAESSVTVPDISFVIDFCLTKNMVVDKVSRFSKLQLEWASHVNCQQRAGRVGRVSNGRVYRMVPLSFYENCLPENSTPEIMRAPLENVVLHAKKLELNEEPKAILALSLNPPNLSNIKSTIWHLKEIGALLQTCKGQKNISDGDITFLGSVMSALPLDVCLSKLIVLGHLYSVLHEAIIMAAGCSIQNLFSTPFNERFQAYNKKLLWANGSCSDLIALLTLYNVWTKLTEDGSFHNQRDEYLWCKENLVNYRGLREWHLLIKEITARLKHLGIEEPHGEQRVPLHQSVKATVLKVIICGAFYPNYFIRSAANGQIDEKEAVKTLGGHDPYRTVYLKGIDPDQPAGLYSKEIKKMLNLDEDAKVETDSSSKIYIEFKNQGQTDTVYVDGRQCVTTIPGKIAFPVYQMVKKRMLKIPLSLEVLPAELARDHYKSLQNKSKENQDMEVDCPSQPDYNPIPSLGTEEITVCISNMFDAGHFYCQNVDEYALTVLLEINKLINTQPLNKADVGSVHLNGVYAVQYESDKQFYRAKVQKKLSETRVQVLFIDYGNIQHVPISDLYNLPDDPKMKTAPLAMECVLTGVAPVLDFNQGGIWSNHVNNIFADKTKNTILYGKVFAVVDDVVHLELFKNSPRERGISINQWLINQNFARPVEESFLCKQDNEVRRFVRSSADPDCAMKMTEAKKLKEEKKDAVDFDSGLRGLERYLTRIQLKGPFSPLETKIYNAMCNSSRSVDIDPQSVNSVLLDSDPLDPHTRLLVAGSIIQSPHDEKVMLRHTTIMPNMPGFPFLMALLFCPEMEPKLNQDKTRISAILCGLGTLEDSTRACYPTHDLLFTLDIDLNEDIINHVNDLRFAMNQSLKELKNVNDGLAHLDTLEPLQRTVKSKLIELLKMKLNRVNPDYVENGDLWKNYPVNVTKLTPPVEIENRNVVWPLHWFFQVQKFDEDLYRKWKNVENMEKMAKRLISFEVIGCELCCKEFNLYGDLAQHLINPIHMKNKIELQQALHLD